MRRRELVGLFTLPLILGFKEDVGLIDAIEAATKDRQPSITYDVTDVVEKFIPLGSSPDAAEASLDAAGFTKTSNHVPPDADALKASDYYVSYRVERDVIFLISSRIYVIEVGVKNARVSYISAWVYGSSI